MQKFILCCSFLAVFGFISCDNSVHRVDPYNTPNEVNTRFDIKDSDIFIGKMVGSLANNNRLKPNATIRVVKVINKTSEHVDIKEMTKSISKHLINLGRFKIVSDVDELQDVIEEREYSDTGYGPVGGGPHSKEQFADYIMQGQLIEITKHGGGVTDRTFKFTLQLTNKDTSVIEWIEDETVRKQQNQATVGW